MNRREALQSLASVVAATGMTVTPVNTQEAQGVDLVLLKVKDKLSAAAAENLREAWTQAISGTSLEHAKALVLEEDYLSVEFVRTKSF